MKKSIIIPIILVVILGIGAYFYNFYNKNVKYNLTTQYADTNKQSVDLSNEVAGQEPHKDFLLIGKMSRIRIDSLSKAWWGQATIMGGAEPNST